MILTGQGLADYAISKIGTPYFYGSKMTVLTDAFMQNMHRLYPNVVTNAYISKAIHKNMVGKVCCDCSGLIGAYRNKQIGSSQLLSSAKKRMPIANVKDFAVGTVLWKKGHVGVYIGMENGIPMCVEEKGIDYGCIRSKVSSTKWVYGLTYSNMEYQYDVKLSGIEQKINPFQEPKTSLKIGAKGIGVKWLQFELVEAGFELKIDGDFGEITLTALMEFQKSAKIEIDGICGSITRSALKVD